MKIHFIYKIIPVPVFKASWMVRRPFDAMSYGLFVVHRGSINDGLLQHELVHCQQLWRTCFLHPILYWLSEPYRLEAEIEGYAEQVKLYPGRIDHYARFIAREYGMELAWVGVAQRLEEAAKLP